MTIPNKPNNEQDRLKALYSYNILNTSEEADFDNIVKLASQICNCPISLISLIDNNYQWFKAKVGLDVNETSRDESFCAHAILNPEGVLLVPDAKRDVRFHDNPLVTGEPNIRFYAGVPLVSSTGYALGTLCVINTTASDLNEGQEFALKTLAHQVVSQIELRQKVTRLENANLIINEQNTTLERLNQSKVKLISILSHDIRSALSSLKSVVTLFNEGDLHLSEIYHLMELTDGQLDSTTELLENLLKWSVTQLDTKDLQLQPISLNYLVNEVFKLNECKADLKNNKLENLIPADIQIKADKDIVQFLLRNLIGNANKFTEKGNIRIRLEEDSNYYNISVIDTGVGLSEEQLNKLFFTQFRNTTQGTLGEQGSGIGLQLCKELIFRHKGKIKAESQKNVGTNFTFSIPKKIEDSIEKLDSDKMNPLHIDYSFQTLKSGVA